MLSNESLDSLKEEQALRAREERGGLVLRKDGLMLRPTAVSPPRTGSDSSGHLYSLPVAEPARGIILGVAVGAGLPLLPEEQIGGALCA